MLAIDCAKLVSGQVPACLTYVTHGLSCLCKIGWPERNALSTGVTFPSVGSTQLPTLCYQRLVHIERVRGFHILVHDRMHSREHRSWTLRLKDVAAHIHPRRTLLDCVVR